MKGAAHPWSWLGEEVRKTVVVGFCGLYTNSDDVDWLCQRPSASRAGFPIRILVSRGEKHTQIDAPTLIKAR